MSTTLKTRTVQQRALEATRQLQQMFSIDDQKLLSAALAVAAVEEAAHNQAFVTCIRNAYSDLVAVAHTQPLRKKTDNAPSVQLTPLPGTEGIRIDPYAPLDPYLLARIYGAKQLRQALSVYSLTKLKQALTAVEQKNPNTKPRNRGLKDAVVDYLVEKVAGPGY